MNLGNRDERPYLIESMYIDVLKYNCSIRYSVVIAQDNAYKYVHIGREDAIGTRPFVPIRDYLIKGPMAFEEKYKGP